tara:strand:+ start:925 stop:1818 length:894 start_codon:yes stop_codon:yes gene_type:complete
MSQSKNSYSLINTNNYKTDIEMSDIKKYYSCYNDIIHDFFNNSFDTINYKNKDYFMFVMSRGIDSLKNIFLFLMLYTKNIELCFFHTNQASTLYVEFMSQISEDNNSYLQLNSKDATLFIYKKTIYEINNDYKKNFKMDEKHKDIFKSINLLTSIMNEMYDKTITDFYKCHSNNKYTNLSVQNDKTEQNDKMEKNDKRIKNNINSVNKLITKYFITLTQSYTDDNSDIFIRQLSCLYEFCKFLKDKDEGDYINIIKIFIRKIKNSKMESSELKRKLIIDNYKSMTRTKFINYLFINK